MEIKRVDKMMIKVVILMGWLALMVIGGPIKHKVGGSKGWYPNINYTLWSTHQHFYIGDWLLFVFDKHYYNVLEVNKTSYEKCIERNYIKNETHGGRDVVELKEAKTYYYISGGGYCFHQMKLVVNVQQHLHPPISIAPPPPSSTPMMKSSSSIILSSVFTLSFLIHVNVLFMIMVSICAF